MPRLSGKSKFNNRWEMHIYSQIDHLVDMKKSRANQQHHRISGPIYNY